MAVDGWSKLTGHDVIDLAKKCEDYGVEGIIYTDIGRDGMLSGINIEATVKLAQALMIPVIASGGLSSMEDIRQLCAVEHEGIFATIAGYAIFDGSVHFAEEQEEADRATSICRFTTNLSPFIRKLGNQIWASLNELFPVLT